MLIRHVANQCTKFDVSSCVCSRDILGGPNILMCDRSRDYSHAPLVGCVEFVRLVCSGTFTVPVRAVCDCRDFTWNAVPDGGTFSTPRVHQGARMSRHHEGLSALHCIAVTHRDKTDTRWWSHSCWKHRFCNLKSCVFAQRHEKHWIKAGGNYFGCIAMRASRRRKRIDSGIADMVHVFGVTSSVLQGYGLEIWWAMVQ